MERNSSSVIIAVILALIIGGVAGYFIGKEHGEEKEGNEGKMMYQKDTNGTGTGATNVTTAPTTTGTAQTTGAMADKMTVSLSTQNSSGQSGTADLSDDNGKVKVVLNLTGGTFTSPQPAHIHMGSCPSPSDVVYPLTDVVNGKSETTLDTTLAQLKEKGALAINVHKSSDEIKVYTACGDIK